MNARQLHYLRSMDIDVWQRRDLVRKQGSSLTSDGVDRPSINPIVESTGQSISPSVSELTSDATLKSTESNIEIKSSASSLAQTKRTLDVVTDAVHHADVNDLLTPSLETWTDVEQAVRNCTKCALHTSRTQTVFGVGDRAAQWMIVGEAPGADEDRKGEPFVGRAGQLLNAMLLAIGLQREQVFIANILKCRPPNNRDPGSDEVNCCMPYLQRQIELINPQVIVCVGRIAAQNLLATTDPIGKLRGSVHYLGVQRRPVVVTYHPAYLLRSPNEKRKAWADLQLALQTFDSAQHTVA